MSWNRWYVIKSYVRGSLWIVPFFAVLVYLAASRITEIISDWLVRSGRIDEASSFLALDMAGAQVVLGTIMTLNISFIVFTFGSLLVAIQVAGGQYTPRIIATTLLRDNAIRFTVGYFVFTLLFAQRVSSHLRPDTEIQFKIFIAGIFGVLSIVFFLYLIDYAARMLRPASIVRRVAESGIAVIESLYPNPTRPRSPAESTGEPAPRQRTDGAALSTQAGSILRRLGQLGVAAVKNVYSKPTGLPHTDEPARRAASPQRVVNHPAGAGVVLAVDLAGLVAAARRADGIIEFVPQVGDFVGVDEPLFRLYGGAAAIDDMTLRGVVAFGSERTIEQDPTYAFRILVDIAIKALSAAINDPTTAVTSIDQLHRLLRLVGMRDLRDEEICDYAGKVRLILRTPNWEDFVHLSCIEIRHCGAGSVQIMRRMRSMLENLTRSLPAHRHAALRLQLNLLDRTIEARYTFPEDLAIARLADSQGLGGALGVQAVNESPAAAGEGRDM